MPGKGQTKTHYRCKKCKELLPAEAFDRYTNMREGRHTLKRRERCRDCRARFKRGENWHVIRGLVKPHGPNPSGMCMCGCGQPTPVSARTNQKKGLVANAPARYIYGHSSRVLSGKLYVVDEETGCWIWQRTVQNSGRPQVNVLDPATKTRKHYLAYRWFYEVEIGPIPDGYELDHLCCNPLCVNPKHMEPVTPQENLARNVRRLRFAGRHWLKTGEVL